MVQTLLIQYRALLARQQVLQQYQHKRLGRRIHDDISQRLTLLSLQLSIALADNKPPADWSRHCQKWSDMVIELGDNLRNILNELQPRILDEFGLPAALHWLANSCPKGFQCRLRASQSLVNIPPAAANELFAVCRDVVNEIFIPNDITEATITLEQMNETLLVHLSTSQQNPELATTVSNTLDALSVHERLFCVDGAVETQLEPAKGLTITLSLPISRQPISNAA